MYMSKKPSVPAIIVLAEGLTHHISTGTVFSNANQQTNVYGDDVEVDYRGYEVSSTVAIITIIRMLSNIVIIVYVYMPC